MFALAEIYARHTFNMSLVLSGLLTIVFVVCVFAGVGVLIFGVRYIIRSKEEIDDEAELAAQTEVKP